MINGISERERVVLNEILVNIFGKLTVHDWEGIEVSRYRSDPQAFAKFLLEGK